MKYYLPKVAFIILMILFFHLSGTTQNNYAWQRDLIGNYNFENRIVPELPGKNEKIRVIIDTDARNEIDDQWAITLALLSPERFEIEGFVAANYDHPHGGPASIQNSYDEIELVLEKAGVKGQFPVFKGSHPMRYKWEPSESEGVDFIIEKAMESTPEDPLWVVALGSATNLASAYLKNPEIADRVVFFWHGRTRWPEKLWNFNVFGDRIAAITLFHSPVPFVLFDTGTYLTCSMGESENYVKPYGEIGNYLHEFRKTNSWFQKPDKGFFDLGDIAFLVDPEIGAWHITHCPEIDRDMSYRFTYRKGQILRCYHIDRNKTFQLLYDKLKERYGS